MKYVGIDLHKQTIKICIVSQQGGQRKIDGRRQFACQVVSGIKGYFQSLGRFEAVVEATSSYEWLFELLEPFAARLVLANPRKLRVIAESTRKTDSQVLAEFLALDMIPPAHRPSPRVRQHRALVRQRHFLQRRITAPKCKVRHVLCRYNADIPSLFPYPRRGLNSQFRLIMAAGDRLSSRHKKGTFRTSTLSTHTVSKRESSACLRRSLREFRF
jgi:hypothetical protein